MNNNDKDIKEMFENIDKYEIKTSSKQIINSFNASVNENKKKPFLAPLFISFASLGIISAIVIPVVITINNSNNIIDNQDIFNPTKNKYLENQLLTFNAFKNGNNSSLMYRRSNITLDGFNKVVNEYELVHQGVKQLFEINNGARNGFFLFSLNDELKLFIICFEDVLISYLSMFSNISLMSLSLLFIFYLLSNFL